MIDNNEKFELEDIVYTWELQSLLDDFYKLIELPVAIIDLKGKILASAGWQKICTKFHRAHPKARKHCIESDIHLTKNIPEGEFKTYKCKNNMWDIATPIMVSDKHMGNLFIGQLFFDDEPIDYEAFRAQANKYGFDEKEYMAALEQVPRRSWDSIHKFMKFYAKLAQMISDLGYSNFKLSKALRKYESLIKELEENQKQLQKRKNSLRLLTDNMLDMVSQTDTEGNFQYVSSSHKFLLGYEPEELLEKKIFDLVHPDDLEEIVNKFNKAIKSTSPNKVEYRYKDARGHYIWLETYGNVITDKNRKVIGAVFSSRDITDRKKAEEEKEKSLNMFQRVVEGTVQAMGRIVEKRDQYTSGHQQRVAKLACAIANEMGLEKEQIKGLHLAAEIHDIGKTAVPAEILTKPGKLEKTEFEIIKSHPETGYDILKNIEFPWPIADIIFQHHEKIDGTGYNNGLVKEEILLEAKILCVADVVEAMASHRPYRPALGIDRALEEISQKKGTLFDEKVVDACIRLFREKRFVLD